MKRKALIVALLAASACCAWRAWVRRSVGEVTGRVVRKDGFFGTITQNHVIELGGHGFALGVRRPGVTLMLNSGEELFVRTSYEESRANYRRDGEIVTVQNRPNWECLWYAFW